MREKKSKKTKITIYLSKDLSKFADEMGIDLSRYASEVTEGLRQVLEGKKELAKILKELQDTVEMTDDELREFVRKGEARIRDPSNPHAWFVIESSFSGLPPDFPEVFTTFLRPIGHGEQGGPLFFRYETKGGSAGWTELVKMLHEASREQMQEVEQITKREKPKDIARRMKELRRERIVKKIKEAFENAKNQKKLGDFGKERRDK